MSRKVLLLFCSITLSLLCVELLLSRWPTSMRRWFPKGMYVNDSDPLIGYVPAPDFQGEVRTPYYRFQVAQDENGFRGTAPSREQGGNNVFVFGDSYAFGQGVDDDQIFSAVLEELLDDRQVINAGVYGYRPSQAYRLYQRIAAGWSIDTVIVQLCYNDLTDQTTPIRRAVHDGHLNANPPVGAWGEFKNQALLRSELAARIRHAYYALETRRLPRPDYLGADFEARRSSEIESTKELLARWFDEADSRGQRMIVIYIPHEYQVDPESTPLMADWQREEGGVDLDAAHRWMSDFFGDFSSVEYVEASSVFRRHYERGGERLYIPGDFHLNEAGNRKVAELLAVALEGPPGGEPATSGGPSP